VYTQHGSTGLTQTCFALAGKAEKETGGCQCQNVGGGKANKGQFVSEKRCYTPTLAHYESSPWKLPPTTTTQENFPCSHLPRQTINIPRPQQRSRASVWLMSAGLWGKISLTSGFLLLLFKMKNAQCIFLCLVHMGPSLEYTTCSK